jgi:hypothetical protein
MNEPFRFESDGARGTAGAATVWRCARTAEAKEPSTRDALALPEYDQRPGLVSTEVV